MHEKSSKIFHELNKIEKKQQKMMNNKMQNFKNIQLNIVFSIIFDPFIDFAFKQIVLNNLIINKKYFNSFFIVENIDEIFADNI